MRIEIPVSALARFVAGRQRTGNHLAQAARPEGDRPPAGHGRRQDIGSDHDLRGRLIWSAGRGVGSEVGGPSAPSLLGHRHLHSAKSRHRILTPGDGFLSSRHEMGGTAGIEPGQRLAPSPHQHRRDETDTAASSSYLCRDHRQPPPPVWSTAIRWRISSHLSKTTPISSRYLHASWHFPTVRKSSNVT